MPKWSHSGLNFPKLWARLQDYSILDIQCAAPTDFPSRYACSALPQILSAGKKPQHIVSDRQRSLSGLCCCPDKEESICFSSKTSLCLVYQTLTASAMTATPVTLLAVDPEQLSSPEPNAFPDQAALCAEGGRGHTKNTVCVHVTREQRNVSWAQGREFLMLGIFSLSDQLCNFNIRHCNKNKENLLEKKQ